MHLDSKAPCKTLTTRINPVERVSDSRLSGMGNCTHDFFKNSLIRTNRHLPTSALHVPSPGPKPSQVEAAKSF